jgi:sulfite exporter TauE/SafE
MNHAMAFSGSFSLLAAFVAGLAGSIHCLAMCGGLSAALGLRAHRLGASPKRTLGHALSYQAGRLASYSLAGALAGMTVGLLQAMFDLEHLQVMLRALAGLVLIGAAIGILFRVRPLARIEKLGAQVWRYLAPLARSIPANRFSGSLLLGMLWGWLPCGMVYSMLLIAALAGNPVKGAATMLCFGLGTVPTVLTAGLASAQILRLNAGRRLNVVFGSLLLAFGVLTLLAPFTMHVHS